MISNFFDFITSKDHRISKKIGIFFVCILTFLAIDYLFRFSDSYITDSKISQLDKIQTLLKDPTLSPNVKNELFRLQGKVIKRKGFWDFSTYCITVVKNKLNAPNMVEKESSGDIPTRSFWWHTITSASLCIFLMITFFVTLLYFIFAKKTEPEVLIGIVVSEIVLGLLVMLFSYVLAQIPILRYPLINYILNVVINLIILGIIYLYVKLKESNTDE